MNFCFHDWQFPRRYERFEGLRAVDVQTCGHCGKQRISPVQFGPESITKSVQSSAQPSLIEEPNA